MADRIYATYTPTSVPGTFHAAIHYERTDTTGDVVQHSIIEAEPEKKLSPSDKMISVIKESLRDDDEPSRFGKINAEVRSRKVTDDPKEPSDDPNAPYEIIAEGNDLSRHFARMQLYADGFN
jgi:hypothetical protein